MRANAFVRRRRRASRWKRLVVAALLLLCLPPLVELGFGFAFPLPEGLLHPRAASRVVVAADGTWLRVEAREGTPVCLPVPLAEVSPQVVRALCAAEDRRFFAHTGIDFAAIVRACAQNFARGRTFSGASTLTMQLARLVEPVPRTLGGKLWQALRARQIERVHTKKAILAAYLDLVPFAGNVRGIEAAARLWFGKRAQDLDLVEAATLVGMLPAPGRRSPTARPALVRAARDTVLHALHETGDLDDAALAAALTRPLDAHRRPWPRVANDAVEHALRRSESRVVHSTIDLALQRSAEDVVTHARALSVAGIAIVVLDRRHGGTVALVGQRDALGRGLDHSLRARPAGSTLKPLLYALALEDGVLGGSSTVDDRPFEAAGYRPRNASRSFAGDVPLAEALADSKNVPAVRLLADVGISRFRDFLVRLGLDPGPRELGLDAALGTLGVEPFALAHAYRRLFEEGPNAPLASSHRTALFDALARRSPDAGWLAAGPLAWKTGTSSDRRDAWSVGVTAQHVVVVWAGEPTGRSEPGLVGAKAASSVLAPLAAALR